MHFPAVIPKLPSGPEYPTLSGKKRKELLEVIHYAPWTILKVPHLLQDKEGEKVLWQNLIDKGRITHNRGQKC